MVEIDTFRQIALSFSGTEANPHFDRTAFKVTGRRIFASIHEPSKSVNIVLTPEDQKVYSKINKKAIYPVPNKFGLQGWTTFELTGVDVDIITDALWTAYNEVIKVKPKKKLIKGKPG